MDNGIIEKIKKLSENMADKMRVTRRDFHKYPESGWLEYRTSSIAQNRLKEFGYNITMGSDAVNVEYMKGVPDKEKLLYAKERAIKNGADSELVNKMGLGLTGFWADMEFSNNGPFLAFRFDMDSNNVTESTDENHRPNRENFASVNNGEMHACGHDGHVSLGLALAESLLSIKEHLKGRVRFIFQPAEEGLRGAEPMVKAGAVNGVTHIIGTHLGFQAVDASTLICGTDKFLASTKFDVTFKGLSAHAGAHPEQGRNALLAGCNAVMNMYGISRHGDGATRINVGKFNSGEDRNIIADSAELIMETRGETDELNDYMVQEVKRIIEASALMNKCSYSIKVAGGSVSGKSDKAMIDYVKTASKYIPEYSTVIENINFGAGEDFAVMLGEVQKNGGIGTYIQAGIERKAGHHNNCFDFNEDGMVNALKVLLITSYLIMKQS